MVVWESRKPDMHPVARISRAHLLIGVPLLAAGALARNACQQLRASVPEDRALQVGLSPALPRHAHSRLIGKRVVVAPVTFLLTPARHVAPNRIGCGMMVLLQDNMLTPTQRLVSAVQR